MLNFDRSYSFSIQVHDGIAWSRDRVFTHDGTAGPNPDSLTDDVVYDTGDWNQDYSVNDNNGDANTFTTYKHNFPVAIPGVPLVASGDGDVEFLPDSPSAGEEVRLTPHSIYYNDDNIGGIRDCNAVCRYNWSVDDGEFKSTGINTVNNLETPIVIFNNDSGTEGYGFTVTDPDGYSCSTGVLIEDVNKKLPSWSEVY